ncbi:phenylalanine--tRNA ligase subunit alpha [bacterium]|nr:phenylalanine--tRNA ligase subunit alpha [bacterium]
MSVLEQLNQLRSEAEGEIVKASSQQEIDELWVRFFGRKAGELTTILRGVKDVPAEERPSVGKLANEVKAQIEELFKIQKERIYQDSLNERLASEKIDVTLPGVWNKPGRIHLLNATMRRIKEVFKGLGYSVVSGPEVETDYYNFEALNIPANHPSREMWDSFFLREGLLMRSQTSSNQIHVMEKQDPPVRIISPGKCYRRDSVDATHFWEFHQIEGLLVDEKVTFSDLKGTLELFAKGMFGSRRKTRFNPSYFPFTEPSAEVMVDCFVCEGKGCRVCKNSGWIEIMGSGMVHPHVLRNVGYDPEKYTGFAFGMGVERVAMLTYALDDIRVLFENDQRFLDQF